MWSFALRLLADEGDLSSRLENAIAGASDEESVHANVARALRGSLEDARREFSNTSAARQKVWERVNAVSLAVQRGQPTRPVTSPEHLQDVLRRTASQFPSDRNLPRTLETLEQYFREFCLDWEGINQADLIIMMDEIAPNPMEGTPPRLALHECLDALSKHDERVHAVIDSKFGLGDTSFRSVREMMEETDTSRRKFESLTLKGLGLLKECIEDRMFG